MLTSATKTNSKILTYSSTTFYTPTDIFDSFQGESQNRFFGRLVFVKIQKPPPPMS